MQLVAAFFQLTKSDWVLEPSLIFVKDKLQMMCQTNHLNISAQMYTS